MIARINVEHTRKVFRDRFKILSTKIGTAAKSEFMEVFHFA